MVLDKLPVPGRPTYLDNSKAGLAVHAVGVGGVTLYVFSRPLFLFFLSLNGRRPDTD